MKNNQIVYYIDTDTEEIIRARYSESLSKTDYNVIIKDNGDIMAVPKNGETMLFLSKEDAEEYKAGYYFVPMEGDGTYTKQGRGVWVDDWMPKERFMPDHEEIK